MCRTCLDFVFHLPVFERLDFLRVFEVLNQPGVPLQHNAACRPARPAAACRRTQLSRVKQRVLARGNGKQLAADTRHKLKFTLTPRAAALRRSSRGNRHSPAFLPSLDPLILSPSWLRNETRKRKQKRPTPAKGKSTAAAAGVQHGASVFCAASNFEYSSQRTQFPKVLQKNSRTCATQRRSKPARHTARDELDEPGRERVLLGTTNTPLWELIKRIFCTHFITLKESLGFWRNSPRKLPLL